MACNRCVESSELAENYLRATTYQLKKIATSVPTEDDWMQRCKLMNSVKNICEVAELGKEKYPEVCNRLLEEGLAVSVKYASILTPECKQKLDAFEDGIEAAAYGNSAREYKQLYQHYKFLQRAEALALAACFMGDGDSLDNLVTKMSNIKTFLEKTQNSTVWEPLHFQVVSNAAKHAFQMAVDTSLAINVARMGQPKYGDHSDATKEA
jgi:hypothetical protein